ncbi:MAG: serine hydrolase domain-containing protein [Spirosomataceae bacterium]
MKRSLLTFILTVVFGIFFTSCKSDLETIAPQNSSAKGSAAAKSGIDDLKILQFDPLLFKEKVDAFLNAQALSGYSYSVFVNGKRVVEAEGRNGWARKNADAPAASFHPMVRQEVASCSKYITTLAMLKMLERADLSLDTPIWPFLPTYMDPHPNFKNISFRQLLSYHSGLIGGIGDLQISLAEMQQTVEGGINMSLYNNRQYNNMNFALCRVLLTYVYWEQVQKLGLKEIKQREANISNLDNLMANVFLSFVRTDVFKAAELPNWGVLGASDPSNQPVTMYYNSNTPTTPGVGIGGSNSILNLGSVGFDLNAVELAQITAAARAGKIVSAASMEAIKEGYKTFPLGFNNAAAGKYGQYYYKFGGATQNVNNLTGGLATMIVDFDGPLANVQVAVVSNQNNANVTAINWIQSAFDSSWK